MDNTIIRFICSLDEPKNLNVAEEKGKEGRGKEKASLSMQL